MKKIKFILTFLSIFLLMAILFASLIAIASKGDTSLPDWILHMVGIACSITSYVITEKIIKI